MNGSSRHLLHRKHTADLEGEVKPLPSGKLMLVKSKISSHYMLVLTVSSYHIGRLGLIIPNLGLIVCCMHIDEVVDLASNLSDY